MKSAALILALLLLVICGQTVPPPTQTAAPVVPTPTAPFVPSPTIPQVASQTPSMTCTPTMDDGLSPSYKPDAPVRAIVGQGHVLTGVVRSSRDCAPVANAQLELWPEIAGQGHPDEARATIFTDSEGRYRFECAMPEHIHMRISAPGFRTLAQNSYHPDGAAEGTFDIVLVPESP
jgi:protocatechuate 3,4-dioxygenase beta subunit